RNRVIDGTYDYNSVLNSSPSTSTVTVGGQRRISLQAAINEKLLRVESTLSARFGSGIGVRFISQSRLPLTIQIREPLAVGERPGTYGNKSVLEILRTARPDRALDSEEIQQLVWEADSDR